MCTQSPQGSNYQFSFCPHGTVSIHLGSTTVRLHHTEFADFVAAADHALTHINQHGFGEESGQPTGPPWTN